jgi:sn-glycerol 3-phosphate transport system permease protein
MKRHSAAIHGWLLLLPAAVLLGAFTHGPTLATIWHSLHSTPRRRRPAEWIGLDHYAHMLEDPIFMKALWNNLLYALATIPLSIALAMAMAIWVNGKLVGRGALRAAYFTPTVLPMIAVANIWLFFYTPDYGLFDQIMRVFGFGRRNWLGEQDTVLWALSAMTVWKEAGFFMIFYLAALQQIPPSLTEAAALEGASRWTYFRRVVFPLLMPTTLFVMINAVINSARLVDHVVAITRGGPDNASSLLLFYLYEIAFKFWDTGYAAAITVVLLALLAALALGQYFLLDRRIHYR